LAGFSKGFFALAEQFGVDLIGGDTTRGPLNISVTILGEVESGRALRRDGAKLGDDVWVSGQLGGAALGLRHLLGTEALTESERADCLARLHTPTPRVALGRALLGVANGAIDVSDGLLADLGHILERSGAVGAKLELHSLPVSEAVSSRLPMASTMSCLLAGGDDYELCFTASPTQRDKVLAAAESVGVAVARIGRIDDVPGLRVLDSDGRSLDLEVKGYDHFTA
jgi:thiamine-monophosphate kinase